MALDVEAARAAVGRSPTRSASSLEEAAEGILAIVNENMAGALRVVSVQRGHDPRDFALVAFGGAGPLHANAVAELMGSFPVIVPPSPGLLCALGDLVADFRNEFAQHADPAGARGDRPRRSRRSSASWRRARGRGWTPRGSRGRAAPSRFVADMRYHGQGYEIPVPLERDARDGRSRSASTRCTSSSTASACRTPRPRSSTCARSATASRPTPELPHGRAGGADASGAIVDEHAILFEGERADAHLRPRAAAARATASPGRRSSPSSTPPPSSCPATRPRSTPTSTSSSGRRESA